MTERIIMAKTAQKLGSHTLKFCSTFDQTETSVILTKIRETSKLL